MQIKEKHIQTIPLVVKDMGTHGTKFREEQDFGTDVSRLLTRPHFIIIILF